MIDDTRLMRSALDALGVTGCEFVAFADGLLADIAQVEAGVRVGAQSLDRVSADVWDAAMLLNAVSQSASSAPPTTRSRDTQARSAAIADCVVVLAAERTTARSPAALATLALFRVCDDLHERAQSSEAS